MRGDMAQLQTKVKNMPKREDTWNIPVDKTKQTQLTFHK